MELKDTGQIQNGGPVSKCHVNVKQETQQNGIHMEDKTFADEKDFTTYKRMQFILLFSLSLCYGCTLEVVGPSLRDLKDRVGVNYEQISQSLSTLSGGVLIGALVSGATYDLFPKRRSLFAACGFGILGASTISIPYAPNLEILIVMFFISGISQGILEIGLPGMVFYIWGEGAIYPVYATCMGFGLGAIFTPQIINPFLSTDLEDLPTDSPILGSTEIYNTTEEYIEIKESRIEIPYAIVGGICLLMSVLLFIDYIIGTPKGYPVREKARLSLNMCSPASCAYGKKNSGAVLLGLLFIFYLLTVGMERSTAMFMFAYATDKDSDPLPKSQGTLMNTVFWSGFTISGIIALVAVQYISVNVIMWIISFFLLVSTTILSVWSYDNNIAMWIGFTLLGVTMITYPSGLSWGHKYLQMNNMAIMVLVVGSQVGALIFQYLTGFLFEYYGPQSFVYFLSACSVCIALNFTVMFMSVRCLGFNPLPSTADENIDKNDTEDNEYAYDNDMFTIRVNLDTNTHL